MSNPENNPKRSVEEFMKCKACRKKPGSPVLCPSCSHNRIAISSVHTLRDQLYQTEALLNEIAESRVEKVKTIFELKDELVELNTAYLNIQKELADHKAKAELVKHRENNKSIGLENVTLQTENKRLEAEVSDWTEWWDNDFPKRNKQIRTLKAERNWWLECFRLAVDQVYPYEEDFPDEDVFPQNWHDLDILYGLMSEQRWAYDKRCDVEEYEKRAEKAEAARAAAQKRFEAEADLRHLYWEELIEEQERAERLEAERDWWKEAYETNEIAYSKMEAERDGSRGVIARLKEGQKNLNANLQGAKADLLRQSIDVNETSLKCLALDAELTNVYAQNDELRDHIEEMRAELVKHTGRGRG